MKNENEILSRPLKIEIGIDLIPFLKSKSWNAVADEISKMRERLKKKRGIDMPRVNITDNTNLKPDMFVIKVFGKDVCSMCVEGKQDFYKRVLTELNNIVTKNPEWFTEGFLEAKRNFNKMLNDNSREAYQFMVNYYTFIEQDHKQKFHWIKKLSYFRVPSDLRDLARCYRIGLGCEQDNILAEKFYKKGRSKEDS